MNRLAEIASSLVAVGRGFARFFKDYGSFVLGTALGGLLAFTFYVGLRPRVEEAVKKQDAEQREKVQKEQQEKDLAALARQATAAHEQKLSSAAKQPSTTQADGTPWSAPKPTTTTPAATLKDTVARQPSRHTQLQATPALANGPSRQTTLKFLAISILATLAAGAAAWHQYRQQPRPDVAKSKVLEALLLLKAHQRMQQRLGLTPRQIKRFNSKARVQHSQLQALAQRSQAQAQPADSPPPQEPAPFAFPVSSQVQAFQLLLLLEESRQQPGALLQADRASFVRQLQTAYAQHPELAEARREAAENATINRAGAGLDVADQFAALGQQVPPRLLEQLFEMNTGLLA